MSGGAVRRQASILWTGPSLGELGRRHLRLRAVQV
jgi:hypothetical protein